MAELGHEPEATKSGLDHPREHKGLAEKLRALLRAEPDPAADAAKGELEATRQARRTADAEAQRAKLDRLDEVSGEHRVVSARDRYERAASPSTDSDSDSQEVA